MRWVLVLAVIVQFGCNTLLAWQLRKSEDLAQTATAQTKQALAAFDSVYGSFKSLSGAFDRLDVAGQRQLDILATPQDRIGVPTSDKP